MSEATGAWRWLHLGSVVVNLVPKAWGVMRSFWPLLLMAWFGSGDLGNALFIRFDAGLLGLFFLATVGSTVKHWATLRYRVHDGRLEIRTGLLFRQLRTIDPGRIQNIELITNVFHKLAGLVEVRIETASGTEVEGLLSALSKGDAEALRDALEQARGVPEESTEEVIGDLLVANGLLDLFRFGATAMRFGMVAVGLGIVFEMLVFTDPDNVGGMGDLAFGVAGALALLALMTGAWLVGVLTAVARHYGFTLRARTDALVVEGGLFTRRRLELPRRKVQLVTLSEPLLRRLAGFGSLTIETAAARAGEGGTERRAAMAPVVERAAFDELLIRVLPELDVKLREQALRRPHSRALLRGMARALWQTSLLTAFVGWALGPLWLALGMLFLPVALVLAWLDHRYQGWLVTERVIIAREGYLSRQSTVVSRAKLQSVEVSQGPLLRRIGLGRLTVRVAGSSVALPLLAFDEAVRVADQVAKRV